MKILMIHGYSADNLGDGLLIEESMRLIEDSIAGIESITIVASRPASFRGVNAEIVSSALNKTGFSPEYLKTLLRISSFDLVVAVGGGYLRFGRPLEALKTLLIHGPQLFAASLGARKCIYLSQSIGPFRYFPKFLVKFLMSKFDLVAVRDDKSFNNLSGIHNLKRLPDLALISGRNIVPMTSKPHEILVYSVRYVNGQLPMGVVKLGELMERYDVYIQSTVGGNDDTHATLELGAHRTLSTSELLYDQDRTVRVVIAVRLHAALMALKAGHYVIHLSYERKGYGAFQDLGLSDFVHNVNSFDPQKVYLQAQQLLTSEECRRAYRSQLSEFSSRRKAYRDEMISLIGKVTERS